MANDQKNEQSVMLSLEDILSQDPQLNGNLLSTPLSSQDKKDEIDLSALQRIGAAEREEFVAPTNISNMAYQPIQLKEKKASPVLKGLMLLLGALGLIVGGIYLGEVLKSKLGKDQLIVSQNPQTPQNPQNPQTPQTPQIPQADAINPAGIEKPISSTNSNIDPTQPAPSRQSYLVGLEQAKQLFNQGKFEMSLVVLGSLNDDYPNDIKILSMMGTLWLKMNRPELARTYWENVLRMDPQNRSIIEALKQINQTSNINGQESE